MKSKLPSTQVAWLEPSAPTLKFILFRNFCRKYWVLLNTLRKLSSGSRIYIIYTGYSTYLVCMDNKDEVVM